MATFISLARRTAEPKRIAHGERVADLITRKSGHCLALRRKNDNTDVFVILLYQ